MLTPPKFTNLAKSECRLNIHLEKEVYGQSDVHISYQYIGSCVQCYMAGLL